MDRLKSLGRLDIFGILLPGSILVFVGAYVLFGSLVLLRLPVKDLLESEFLITAVLFVAAYLVGSLLRLFAADDCDKKSSEYLVEAWRRERRAQNMSSDTSSLEEYKAELARGGDVSSDVLPSGFDEWLFRVDEFPYSAWQNRKWQAHGPGEVLAFFRDNYKTSMWSAARTSPKDFFNYCKLVVIGGSSPLADEINIAEGHTRFFAGVMIALHLSIWLLGVALIVQVLLVAALVVAPGWRVQLAFADAKIQGLYLLFTLALLIALRWMCHQIVKRFRRVRAREAMTVYYAFYLCSMSRSNHREERQSHRRLWRRSMKAKGDC
jgi:hypothetical protein